MIQVFIDALVTATGVMLTVAAWLLAIIGFLFGVVLLAIILAALFDAATGFLSWFWRRTKHKPRGRIQRIIMGHKDDDV